MQPPYLLMVVFFFSLAMLGALDAALASLGWVQWFNGLRWLRVHFINIGVLAEMIFGVLPVLAARRAGYDRPSTRWDIWLLLNAGLMILLIGMPLINAALIITGGTLILLAAIALMKQLYELRGASYSSGLPFYLTGLAFLLIGAFLGMGIWLGWGAWLGLANVKEVHVHANLWGFLAPIYAGLLVDLYPSFTGRALDWVKWSWGMAALMAIGALGMVVGPWIELDLLTSGGLILHTVGIVWLLVSVIKPLIGTGQLRAPGILHLITAYIWFLIPVVVAPLIVANATNFPVGQIVSNGGPILIYGWALQFSYALIPYLFARTLLPDAQARLGGSWFSLIGIHLGGVVYWLGLFLINHQSWLHAAAFILWSLSMLPVLATLWRIVSRKVMKASMSLQLSGL